jgi:hypothetical protein
MGEEEAMIAQSPVAAAEGTRWSASRLTRLSFVMIAVYVLVAVILGFFGSLVLMPWLGLSEGDLLLMAGGTAGWVAEITMSLLLIVPAVVGVVAAAKSLRRGGPPVTWVPLVLLTMAGLQVILAFVDAIHMTYYPQGGWLIW